MTKSILVVEDDSDMRAWVSLQLRSAGYIVREAVNGFGAAAACLQKKPDLIISDLHMPTMGGFDMLKILNSEATLRDIPVIVLTADAGKRERGNQLGATGYLTKPIDAHTLVHAVASHLHGTSLPA